MTISSRVIEANSLNQTQVSSHHLLVFSLIFSVAVVLRLIFFQGYSDSDPGVYTVLADQFSRGEIHVGPWDGPVHFPVRFAVYVPTALVFKLFGVSELTIAFVPLLVGIGNMVLAYLIACRLFNPFAGLISVAVLAVVPSNIVMATTLWPDPIGTFWANFGVAFLILGYNPDSQYGSIQSVLIWISAGLCFGIAWLGKETVLYYGPFVAILLFLQASPRRWSAVTSSLLLVGFTASAVLLAEASIYRAFADDWFFHFRSIEANYKETAVWWFDQSSPYFGWGEGGYAKALLKRLIINGPKALLSSFSNLAIFALVALAWAAFTRDRRFFIPGIWLLSLMLVFEFGSTSLFGYKPLPLWPLSIWERFLYPMLLPSAILVGGVLGTLWQAEGARELRSERKFWAFILVMALSLSCLRDAGRLMSRPEQVVREISLRLKDSDLVYTDHRSASTLVFLRSGKLLPSDSTTVPYENISLDALRPGSLVFINKDKLEFLAFSYGYKIPALVSNPPKTWVNVWSEKGSALFRVQ